MIKLNHYYFILTILFLFIVFNISSCKSVEKEETKTMETIEVINTEKIENKELEKPIDETTQVENNNSTELDYVYDGEFKDDYIGVVLEDTPLLVTDIEFCKMLYDENELYYVPWIKVKTPENIEGWFCLVYGD